MELFVVLYLAAIGLVLGNPAPAVEYGKSHSIAKRDACTATSSLNAEQKQILLDAHNHARHVADPAPYESLVDLTWDEELASRAQELADSCRFAHDILYDCADIRMGQNLAWYGSSFETVDDDLAAHVNHWDAEKEDYDIETGACSAVCGHYTQLVWSHTTRVGCGYKNCQQLYNFDWSLQRDLTPGSAWLLVCDYSAAGNYVGEKPYATEYIELEDNMGAECQQWVYMYCNDPVYGQWANNECALTCSQM